MRQKKATTSNISKDKQRVLLYLNNIFAFNLILFAILFVSIIRLKFLNIPLERDEGEYAYMAQLLLQGSLPYTEAYSMKLPGIYLIYAGILSILGQTHAAIHLALLLVNIATAILIFFIGRFFHNNLPGAVAGVSFLVMTISPTVLGLWAHATHFIMLFALCGLLIMLIAIKNNSLKFLFLSGILLGFAPLIKQHGIFFSLFGVCFLCWTYSDLMKKSTKDFTLKIGLFVLAAAIPYCLIATFYLLTGNISNFWLWTIQYPLEYVSLVPISDGAEALKTSLVPILKNNITIFLLFIAGVAGIFYDKDRSAVVLFYYGFFVSSFLSILPGFYFRPHYFITLLPAISLLAAIGLSFGLNKFNLNKKS